MQVLRGRSAPLCCGSVHPFRGLVCSLGSSAIGTPGATIENSPCVVSGGGFCPCCLHADGEGLCLSPIRPARGPSVPRDGDLSASCSSSGAAGCSTALEAPPLVVSSCSTWWFPAPSQRGAGVGEAVRGSHWSTCGMLKPLGFERRGQHQGPGGDGGVRTLLLRALRWPLLRRSPQALLQKGL